MSVSLFPSAQREVTRSNPSWVSGLSIVSMMLASGRGTDIEMGGVMYQIVFKIFNLQITALEGLRVY